MSKLRLESRVLDSIHRHSLIPRQELVVVAVSGGADSVCLLHVLAKCRKQLGAELHVAHLNHQLRGTESEADAEYVFNLARSLGIPSTIERQDVSAYRAEGNRSIEEAARELRYAFFASVAEKVKARRIVIGHTKDDQVETILMHILRGTGTLGLRGLEASSAFPVTSSRMSTLCRQLLVIRPLLDITREEIAGYCHEHQLEPRIDSSNLSPSFFRNRLRLHLLPLLRQYNPSIDQALLRLADIAKEDNNFIEQQSSSVWDEVAREEHNAICLDKERLAALPIALQRHLLRAAVTKLAGDVRDIEAIHIEATRDLLNKPASKRISLPHGLICHGGYDEMVIANADKLSQFPACPFPPLASEFALKVPGQTVFSGWKVIASIVRAPIISLSSPSALGTSDKGPQRNLVGHFDLKKTGMKLIVCQSKPGDRFQPLGMKATKRLSEFMVDVKIPRSWRSRIPIVCSPRQIVWVVGWRIDDRVKVTKASKEVLRLQFSRSQ